MKNQVSEQNFKESYLSEFLRYGLRKKCVRKPLIHTFQKLTSQVTQNILRATTTGFVLKLHFFQSSSEMTHPDFREWGVHQYRCSEGSIRLQTSLLGMFERFWSFIAISSVWIWFFDFLKKRSKICMLFKGITYLGGKENWRFRL